MHFVELCHVLERQLYNVLGWNEVKMFIFMICLWSGNQIVILVKQILASTPRLSGMIPAKQRHYGQAEWFLFSACCHAHNCQIKLSLYAVNQK